MWIKSHTRTLLLLSVLALPGCQVRESAPAPEPAAPVVAEPAAPGAGPTLPPGPVTVIEVSLPDHAPSQAAQAETARLAREFGPRGLQVVGWVVGGGDLADAGYPRSVVTREQLVPLGALRVLPSRVLVDRSGQVRKVFPGGAWPADARAEVEAALAEVGT